MRAVAAEQTAGPDPENPERRRCAVCRRRPGSAGLRRLRLVTALRSTSAHSAGLGPHDSLPEEQGSGSLLPAASAQQCCDFDGRQADRQQCSKRRSQTALAEAPRCRPYALAVETQSTEHSMNIVVKLISTVRRRAS